MRIRNTCKLACTNFAIASGGLENYFKPLKIDVTTKLASPFASQFVCLHTCLNLICQLSITVDDIDAKY